MRRIMTKEQEEKKRGRNQLIIGIMLIGVMFFSVVGYSFMGNEENNGTNTKINYNGNEFILNNGLWFLSGNENLAFQYNPNESAQLSIANTENLKKISNYAGEVVYLNIENSEAGSEVYRNLNSVVKRMQEVCLPEKYDIECKDESYPIKDCSERIIIIKENNAVNSIKQEDNCVFIYANYGNLTLASDEFLFRIFDLN